MVFLSPLKLLLLYIYINVPVVLTHNNFVKINQLNTKNINECQRCRILTESLDNWLDKTSRGQHEGGDAAWEEAKLKSYSRSEMRLVEIQENLCSELEKHQDDCYALSEEAESLLEKWWFQEDLNALDLYSWLCIENLQHCCPSHHFGELCTPCRHDKNNKVCGGNGKCDGDGTRKGDGRCICERGFTGSECDECAENFYKTSKESCEPCNEACDGCHDYGEHSCKKCAAGWHMESGICTDINECLNFSICKREQFCENKNGSYDCKPCHETCETCSGPSSTNCTSCNFTKFMFVIDKCVDVEHIFGYITLALKISWLVVAFISFRKKKSLRSFIIVIISLIMYLIEITTDISLDNLVPSF